ncbi:hypothetical protein Pmani_037954 [Petrolisthes manimaculis]|uniref:Uncharacterized protein n=1 Tax=Petrolisthes manimaculis TaxID=1843537 RepID=A0AAE1NFG2_9EUCA|nr:hypothetical protein Pmani_037954 [Petrolisthes manimaculis]
MFKHLSTLYSRITSFPSALEILYTNYSHALIPPIFSSPFLASSASLILPCPRDPILTTMPSHLLLFLTHPSLPPSRSSARPSPVT